MQRSVTNADEDGITFTHPADDDVQYYMAGKLAYLALFRVPNVRVSLEIIFPLLIPASAG